MYHACVHTTAVVSLFELALIYFPLTQNATLEHYTHYHVEHVMECVYELNAILKKQPESKYQATYKKYQNPKFLSVANIPAVNI